MLPLLPYELHVIVLSFVEKPHLCACALACRDWLELCIARLFDSIYLRSSEDLDRLGELQQRYQPSFIFTYLRYVNIRFHAADLLAAEPMPLFLALSATFPRMEHVRYVCDVTNNENENTPQASLTRSPHSRFAITSKSFYKHLLLQPSNISMLQLSGYSFHSFADLLRICGALHSLAVLHLEAVTWKHTPRTTPTTRGLYHCLREVQAYRCSPECWFLWLWSCLGSANNQSEISYKIQCSDLCVVGDLMHRLKLIPPDFKVTITYETMADKTCEYLFNRDIIVEPWS